MSTEQIEAARKAYDDASWKLCETPTWVCLKYVEERESARRALLALDPGHFSKCERDSFEVATRKTLTPEVAEKRIAEYRTSDVALNLDRL
jgi:hypothetical protein